MKTLTVNGRSFSVPQARDSERKRETLRQLQHHVENLNHDDGFIEERDWDGISEALEIVRTIDHARRERQRNADSAIYTAMVEMRELLQGIKGGIVPTGDKIDQAIEKANKAESG
jgi:hypothetical protein